ncbi:gntR family transcriptional regulator [Collimonas arenae]|nr:gntR family transcriptional regulator [Collimonas arenae]
MRIGYLIAPSAIREAVTVAKHLCDWHAPTMMQWALAKFIDDGYLQKHIRRCHTLYASRRENLLSRLTGDLAPWLQPVPATAGFHLTALTTRKIDLALLLRLARRVDVGLYTIDMFYHALHRRQDCSSGTGRSRRSISIRRWIASKRSSPK